MSIAKCPRTWTPMSDRTIICIECWRDFTRDFLHLDCTGKHVVPKAEADELREWLTGRHEFIGRTGQALRRRQ